MKSSIVNKLGNLINVSSRDSSIFSNINSSHLDLSKYVSFNEVNNFFTNNSSTITINLNNSESELIASLKKTKSFEEFELIIKENNIYTPVTRMKILKQNFTTYKSEMIQYIQNYLSDLAKRVLFVERKAKEIKNDKGSWNLFVTRYFLTGILPNKVACVRAPLLFFPIQISYDKKKGIIQLIKDDDEFILNEKLIIYLLRAAEKENRLMNEFNYVNNVENLIRKIKEIIEFEIKTSKKQNDLSFKNMKLKEIPDYYDGLYFEDGLTYGIYDPSGGKLKQDLEMIIKMNKHKDVFDTKDAIPNSLIEQEELSEEPLIQIGKLDIYQKFAVRSAIKQNTIIHGPPGTGKSEVISNIIANVLLKDKSVVMISEKKAALDVLHKRLKKLSVFMLRMHSDNKDDFYNSILELDKIISRDWQFTKYSNSVDKVISSQIYSNNKTLNNELIKKVNSIIEFENFTHEGYDYTQLNNEITKYWQNIEVFIQIMKNNIIDYLEDVKQRNNLSTSSLISIMNEFSKYIVSNHLSSFDVYKEFEIEVKNFLKYSEEFKFDINDVDRIVQIKKCSAMLTEFLSKNIQIERILKENPYGFYEAINAINLAKKELNGIIHIDLFNDLNNIHNKIQAFLNVINHSKKSSIKYLLDEFAYKNNFVKTKPFSKLFYKTKLSDKDKKVIEHFNNINKTWIQSIYDFEYIYKNSIYFDPLVIMYFFNKKIFDSKYINFINKKYYIYDYRLFEIQSKYKFNEINIDITKKLISAYNVFATQFPNLNEYSLINKHINNFKKISWDNFGELILNEVKNLLFNKLAALSNEDKQIVIEAIRVAGLKRRPSIYKYLESFKMALKLFFPIWISKPEQISLYSPLTENFFDYGIYDEASQMFLERAYPLLFRSKINVIAGDEHQLRPSSFFMSRSDEEDDEDELEMTDYDTQESLLDRAMLTSWNNVILKNHYRSEKKELIEFSNKYVYSNELNYASMNSVNNINGIDVINVKGYFRDGINIEEANKTLEILDKNVNKFKSILVITSNSKQAQLIQQLLFSDEYQNKKVSQMYIENKLEVVCIENVQGNEADLVILSICYAKKDENSKLALRFGPLMKEGGKNRLNVAITRGKKKMIVIKSMTAGEMQINSNSTNKNLITFRDFIDFCDKNEDNKKKLLQQSRKKTSSEYYHFDSDFEKEVFEEIQPTILKRNFILDTQYKVGSKFIDIVVINPEDNSVLLGIEVDGWKYHSKPIKMLEDIYRQQFLESRGYPIFRVLEFEWKHDRNLVLKELYLNLGIHKY